MAKKSSTGGTKGKSFYVTPKENAYLADGTFVAKGDKVKVSSEYVERLRAEKNVKFVITQE